MHVRPEIRGSGTPAPPSPALRWAWAAGLAGLLAACAGPAPPGTYRVHGRTYRPLAHASGYSEVGIASWYGADFHGRRTSSGEVYDMHAATAAHKLLPLGTVVRVTHLGNGRQAVARINDRGPFVDGRVIDLSLALARELDMTQEGTARVRVEALEGPGGAAPPPVGLDGPFAWQVGAFRERLNADGLAARLEASFGPVAVLRYDRGDAVYHRVRVGRYPRADAADRDLPGLRGLGLTPFLVRVD